jgi:hypothetical protein
MISQMSWASSSGASAILIGFASKIGISFSPGFSRVKSAPVVDNRFNGFFRLAGAYGKPLKRFT